MIIQKKYNMMEQLEIYVKMQNIQLLKLIANNEKWDFKELIKYIK
tara:strand:- start:40 stop:174 length:135 start_codon:yes stop_codon:yes gene_type:complete